ncbi:MAG: nucleotidyltransferase family protein [Armatimonadota bacterium]
MKAPFFDLERLAAVCRRHHVRRLAMFGSVLTEKFRPDSDIDILVEFEPGQPVGFIEKARVEQELTDMLGREVDLRTPNDLSPYFRDDVLRQAEELYAA